MTRAAKAFMILGVPLAIAILAAPLHGQSCVTAAQATLAGNLRGSNGIAAAGYTLALVPSQQGYIAGCGVNVATVVDCATSTGGAVVGIADPLTPTINTASGSGALTAGTYYSVYEWYDASGNVTLESPETRSTLSATGSLVVNPPVSGVPAAAVGMDVFIGITSGGETLQGQTTGSASFVQSSALTSGASPASSNSTLCKVTANDVVWPVGTGYNASLTDQYGNPIPGYPMQWQILGAGTTVNLSNGLPYYHGVVMYPVPILASPANHGTQSISGSLNLGGYNLADVGKLGIGTSTPGWPLDVENGQANFEDGLLLGGNAPASGTWCAGSTDGMAVDSYISCLTTANFFYQTIRNGAGTAQTQRASLKFSPSSIFTLSDSSSPSQTTVALAPTGSEPEIVTAPGPGTHGNCATWDSQGGLGDAGHPCAVFIGTPRTCNTYGCYTISSDGTITEWGPPGNVGTAANQTITFPFSFPNGSNIVVMVSNMDTGAGAPNTASNITASSFQLGNAQGVDSGQWMAIGY